MAKRKASSDPEPTKIDGIEEIAVSGFKSVAREQRIEIRPLTVLAGTNSSGKSSALQAILLLKQTLLAPYDPGPLKLDGPNVCFTDPTQIVSKIPGGKPASEFSAGVGGGGVVLRSLFRVGEKGVSLAQTWFGAAGKPFILRPGMTFAEVIKPFDASRVEKEVVATLEGRPAREQRRILRGLDDFRKGAEMLRAAEQDLAKQGQELRVYAARCFLRLGLFGKNTGERSTRAGEDDLPVGLDRHIREVIHVPGLRGSPERAYPTTAVGTDFQGRFENYVASVVTKWREDKDARLAALGRNLKDLGLTWKVDPKQIDATRIELRVGRLPHGARGGAQDLVNIADAGLGVSQVLPVLVALLVAERGQMVYLEQPEIHLHPGAQVALARALTDASLRGVRVVCETHSALLLLSLQTLIAEGELPPGIVKLHWFSRGEDGVTTVASVDPDEAGAFGDWPQDFDDVSLGIRKRFLDAAEQKLGLS